MVITPLLIFIARQAGAIDPDLGRFSRAKEQQIREFGRTITNQVPAIVWSFFDAVRADDWQTFDEACKRAPAEYWISNGFTHTTRASKRLLYVTRRIAVASSKSFPAALEPRASKLEFIFWNSNRKKKMAGKSSTPAGQERTCQDSPKTDHQSSQPRTQESARFASSRICCWAYA